MVAPTPPRASRRALLELPGFHVPEREAMLKSPEGRQRYADARRQQSLQSLLVLLVSSVEDGLRHHRMEALAFDSWSRGAKEWNAQAARAALKPLLELWGRQGKRILAVLELGLGREAEVALRDAEQSMRKLMAHAEVGDPNCAVAARVDAERSLGFVAHRARGLRPGISTELDAISDVLRSSWPTEALRDLPESPGFEKYLRCGERSRDLLAIARWIAPCIAGQVAAGGRDSLYIREVETILSAHGGGPRHMCGVWPELRARIQALADVVAAAGGTATFDSTPDAEREDGVVVFDWSDSAGCVTADGRDLIYVRGTRRCLTYRQAVVRALGLAVRRSGELHWSKSQAGDFNAAVRAAGISAFHVASSSQRGATRVEGIYTFTEKLLAKLGVRPRR